MRSLPALALLLATTTHAAPRPEPARPTTPVSPARLETTVRTLVGFGTRSTFSGAGQPPGRGIRAARDWIEAELRRIAATPGSRMTVSIDAYVQQPNGARVARATEIANVIATIPGSEPGTRTYVLSAHYDSRNSSNDDTTADAPGADDNGSGTAAVLEAARVMATLKPRATVIFALFAAEEQGLLGAHHFADGLKARGVDVQGNLNNDIVGSSLGRNGVKDDRTVRIFSQALAEGADAARTNLVGNENDSPSRQLARFAKAVGDAAVPGLTGDPIHRADRFLRGGDHQAFNTAGFPAIRFVEPFETYAHQHQNPRVEGGVRYGDTPDHMDFGYLARVTRYDVAVLAALALGPGPPTVTIETRELSNDTTLAWTPVPGAVRYEIVTRPTPAPDWGPPALTTTATRATLLLSKDNLLFGVRAIDPAGRRSVTAFPTPAR